MAMFDATYRLYSGIPGNNNNASNDCLRVFPNPCTNGLQIAFKLQRGGKVKIALYDVMETSIKTISDQNYVAGRHSISFDVSGVPAGSYLIFYQTDNNIETRKLLIIR